MGWRQASWLVLALAAGPLTADEAPSPDASRLSELQTAAYPELENRARVLGLATTGSADELRSRIAAAEHLTLPAVTPAAKTLTIDSATEAGLLSIDAPGDGKLLRLAGGLQVTLVDRDRGVTHVVSADTLWYDQAQQEMTARGNVVYTLIRASTKEIFRGESLLFRLNDSQGIFYGGASERPRTVGDQTLTFRYQGEAIRRNATDLVVLDAGSLTSSLAADPNYHIEARKIWVLEPGEWGLQDAVLFLGRVPVLYFPFFFQPGDEFLFNPVLSFPDAGDRRGTSLQTTTYLFGKKVRDTAPLSFLQVEDAKVQDSRVPRGLFLVRGKAPEPTVPADWVLRYLADFYSSLGFLTAVDASLPGWGGFKTLKASAGLGLTRTVGSTGLPFSTNPFQAALDPWAQSDWNGSWLLGRRLPLRWGLALTADLGWGALNLDWYSDPVLAGDLYASRSENFSVFSLLGLGSVRKTPVAAAVKTSLQWNLTLGQAPLSGGASLFWDSKAAATQGPDGDPENTFYVPSQLTLPQASASWAGTFWATGSAAAVKPRSGSEALLPPDPATAAAAPTAAPAAADQGAQTPGDDRLLPPDPLGNLAFLPAPGSWNASVTWSLKPQVKTDNRFDPAAVSGPSDSPWSVLSSRWSGAYDAKLSLQSSWSDGTWSATQDWNLHQQVQDTWYLKPSLTAAQTQVYRDQDSQQRSDLASQNLGAAWKPWARGGPLRDTVLQYSLGTKLYEASAARTVVFDSSKTTVSAHQLAGQGVWYLWEGGGVLKASAGWQTSLPPLDLSRVYSGGLELTSPGVKAASRLTYRQTPTTLAPDPWESSAEFSPWAPVSLKELFQYDLSAGRPLVSTSTLTVAGASVQYSVQRTTPYSFDTTAKVWVAGTRQAFVPQELRWGYALDLPALQWWRNRNSLAAKVNLSWPINLQQYSQMPLNLTYSLTYKLHRFLDVQVSEGVVNRTPYRYFPPLASSFGAGAVPWVNPLSDLADSFSVWDPAALRRTGFKMTSLSLALVHTLDDWQIKLDYSGSPQLGTGSQPQYRWAGTLNLSVQWFPVPELRTQLQVDKDGAVSLLKNSP